ncbi:MAG: hypothetical protein CSA58_01385 [Micrococcales bacterium]|nr:MAG: hypothetical protein CSA58_01385 [Micrococcales bacterium]
MSTNATGTEETVSDSQAAVTVRRTVAHPLDSVWGALMQPHGASALLGEGGELGNKGDAWRAEDGTCGVTRSFHPLQQIRFSWHAEESAPATLVDLHMRAVDDDSTELEIVHDHLPADADREWLANHWAEALNRIDEHAL